jgi:hypothetical protein
MHCNFSIIAADTIVRTELAPIERNNSLVSLGTSSSQFSRHFVCSASTHVPSPGTHKPLPQELSATVQPARLTPAPLHTSTLLPLLPAAVPLSRRTLALSFATTPTQEGLWEHRVLCLNACALIVTPQATVLQAVGNRAARKVVGSAATVLHIVGLVACRHALQGAWLAQGELIYTLRS